MLCLWKVMILDLGEVALCKRCPVFQQYTSHSSPLSRDQLVSGKVLICLEAQFHRLWACIFLASSFCPLVGEACAGFLVVVVSDFPLWVELVHGPLMGRALLRDTFRGCCGLRKFISILSMCWAMFPPYWLFGLRPPNTGACRLLGGAKYWIQCPQQDVSL